VAAAPQVQLDHVLRRAIAKVASDAFEVTVTDARAELVHPREDRDYVLRLTLDASEPLPNVILKRASRPYDPTAPALREPGGFFYE